MEKSYLKGLMVLGLSTIIATSAYVSINELQNSKYSNTASSINSLQKNKNKTDTSAQTSKNTEKINLLTNIINTPNKDVAKGKQIENIKKQAAIERKVLMHELAQSNPEVFLTKAIPKKEKVKLPVSVQAEIEEESVTTGKLIVIHSDDFKTPENSKFIYKLNAGGKMLKISQIGKSEPMISNTLVAVKGYKIGDTIVAYGGKKGIKPTGASPKPESVGPQNTLVMLIETNNDRPFTPQQISQELLGGPFQKFFKEQSYGKVSFKGTFTDWVKIPKIESYWACGAASFFYGDSSKTLQEFLSKTKTDLSKYDRVLYLVSGLGGGGCSGVGKADYILNGKTYRLSESWVGTGDYGVNERDFLWNGLAYVTAHEIGHALGVMHANAWDCENDSMYGNCKHIEYGNRFDTMGYGNITLHFNAFYKELLGWFNPNSGLVISKSGTYTISPLEIATGTPYAKVKNAVLKNFGSSDTPFYLEHRRPIGFDRLAKGLTEPVNYQGLLVNNIIPSYHPHTRLIDASPTSRDWWDDTLDPFVTTSNSISDPGRGIKIGPVRAVSTSTITFDVTISQPTCTRFAPQLTERYDLPQEVGAGSYGYVFFEFINSDYTGCGPSKFNAQVTAPAGWEIVNENDFSAIHAGVSAWGNISFKVPETAPSGTEKVSVKISNTASGLSASYSSDVIVSGKPTISAVAPASGDINTTVSLTGTGFNVTENKVYVCYTGVTGGCASFLKDSPDGQTLSFMFPSRIEVFSKEIENSVFVPSPDGLYGIYVFNGISGSDQAFFTLTSSSTPALPTPKQ